jgi:glutaredoxin 3
MASSTEDGFRPLRLLEPNMTNVTLYSTGTCPYCVAAETLLKKRGITDIQKIRVDQSAELLEEMIRQTGRKTVPQIFINQQHVGGFDDLVKFDAAGKLSS